METLSLDKFSPKRAELVALADGFKSLTINGIDDLNGYRAVYAAKQKLKTTRGEITKQGKSFREDALRFQKDVIAIEKELVDIIEPIEKDLSAKLEVIDKEKEKQKRLGLLPDRKAKLIEIEAEATDEELLAMDAIEFQTFCNVKYSEFLARKEQKAEEERLKLKAEQDKLKADKRKLEEENRLAEVRKQAEKDAQKKAAEDLRLAGIKAEQDKKDAVEAEQKKAEKEKADLIAKQKANEDARLAKEQADKKVKEDKEKKAVEEEEKVKKQAAFQKFLKDNDYSEETKSEFYLLKTNKSIILYRKVSEFIIK